MRLTGRCCGPRGDEAGDVLGVAAAARPYGDMQILAHCRECGTRQGHLVLLAVEAADGERAQRVAAQAVAIADAPDQPLLIGGHELAVDQTDHAVELDVDERAVERVAAAVAGAFDAAEVDGDTVIGRGCRLTMTYNGACGPNCQGRGGLRRTQDRRVRVQVGGRRAGHWAGDDGEMNGTREELKSPWPVWTSANFLRPQNSSMVRTSYYFSLLAVAYNKREKGLVKGE